MQLLELCLEQRLTQEKERVLRQQIMHVLRESDLVEMPQLLPVGQVPIGHLLSATHSLRLVGTKTFRLTSGIAKL